MQQTQEKFIKDQRNSQKREAEHSSRSPDKGATRRQKLRKIGPYILLEQIGKGSYSKVFLARAQWGLFAVKQISLENVKQKQLQRIHQQVEVLSLIKHPNVIEMVDFKQTPNNLYLVFEHCPHTDLAFYIEKYYQGRLPEERVKTIVAQLRDAFRAIRRHRIVHRDLKLSNILLSEDFQIKLADFGFARLHLENEFLNSIVGTPLTMAPQIIERKEYDQRCDIWSLGVITYEMLFGKHPFFTKAKLSMTQIKQSFSRPLQFPTNISLLAMDFLKRMLVKDPKNRMTFQKFFQHPWLKGEENLRDVLKIQALGRQLNRSFSGSLKSAGQKQFLLANCQAVLGFALIEFIRGHLENCLAGWINLAKQIIDLNHTNRTLSFTALAVLLSNIDEALAQPVPVLLNGKHSLIYPKYSELRKLQNWQMSQFSMRLPHLIAKGRASIEGFLQHESTTQLDQIHRDRDCLLSEVLLRQLRREVERGDDQAKVFLRVRPWQSSIICLTIQAPSLTTTAIDILVANVKIEPIEYYQLCRKCSSLFRINIVNQTTPLQQQLQRLRDKMAANESLLC